MAGLNPVLSTLPARLRSLAGRRLGFCVALIGEAGIGKSFALKALVGELTCAASTVRASQSPAEVLLTLPRPLRPSRLIEATLKRLEERAELPEEAVLSAFLAVLSAQAPVVLILEDLHDAPAPLLAFWSKLAALIPKQRGMALLTSSRVPVPPEFEALVLKRQSRAAVAEMLEAEVHQALPKAALDWIFEHAAGNPLYTLEYFRLLARQGNLWNDGRVWRWRTPPQDFIPLPVEVLIEQKLRGAEAEKATQTLLETLALCAAQRSTLQPAQLAEISGLSAAELAHAQRSLLAQGLITADTEFAHPLYREGMLKNMSAARQGELARRAVAVYQQENPEDAAAFIALADLEPGAALHLLLEAAMRFEERGDQVRAGRMLIQALAYQQGEERGQLALRAGKLLYSNMVAEAKVLAQQAVDDLPGNLEALLLLAQVTVFLSRKYEDGLALISHLSEAEKESLAVQEAMITWSTQAGTFVRTLELWQHSSGRELGPVAKNYVGIALVLTGQPEQGETMLQNVLNLQDLKPELRAAGLSYLSIAQLRLNKQAEAEQTTQQALAVCQKHGLDLQLGTVLQNYALNLSHSERYDEMRSLIEQAITAYARAGEPRRALVVQLQLGNRLLEEGQFEEAEALLLESYQGLRGPEPSAHFLSAELELLSLYYAWNHPPAKLLSEKLAASALQQARALGPGVQVGAYAYAMAINAESRWGSAARARELAQEVEDSYPHKPQFVGMMLKAGLAAVAEAEGDLVGAKAGFAAAADEAQTLHLTFDAQLYRTEIDRLNHDSTSARLRLNWFETHGRGRGAILVRRYFPELDGSGQEVAVLALPLSVLGPLALGESPLRGQRRRDLLLLLLEARLGGLSGVRNLDLLESLYPEIDEDTALGSLKQMVFKLRAQYGGELILTTSQGYALGNIQSDAEAFLRGGDLKLWQGLYAGGDHPVPDHLTLALRRAVEAALTSNPAEAARAAQLLVEQEPYDLEALKLCCTALNAQGQHKALGRVYAQARTYLTELGEKPPAEWLQGS